MAVGIGEIDTSPAVVVIDLAGAMVKRIGPVVEGALDDAREAGVEIGPNDQKSVVLLDDRTFGFREV